MTRALAALPTLLVSVMISTSAAAQGMPQPPTPGPEQQILKMDEGTWDAVVEITPGPGAAAITSKGVETVTVACSGLCLISEFKGDLMPGTTFEGHGMTAYDTNKKKYVGSWTDSMSSGISTSEATYDAGTKKMTAWMEGVDPAGNPSKTKSVSEFTDADHRTMTMFVTAPDGKEMQTLKISYARRK
jgi:hypothetical protein